MTKNIVLIGMPGSGKSTVGVILAKWMAYNFLDTDVLIQTRQGRSLQSIVDGDGYMALRQIEADVLKTLDLSQYVIATGGSAPYSDSAMRHLKKTGLCVFLDVNLSALVERIDNFEKRGIARQPSQSLEALYQERHVLYRQYADLTINGSKLTQEQVCAEIMSAFSAQEGALFFTGP